MIRLGAAALATASGLAACGGQEPDPAVGAGDASTSLSVVGADGIAFEPDALRVPSGEEISVELTAEPAVMHDLVIAEAGRVKRRQAGGGRSARAR